MGSCNKNKKAPESHRRTEVRWATGAVNNTRVASEPTFTTGATRECALFRQPCYGTMAAMLSVCAFEEGIEALFEVCKHAGLGIYHIGLTVKHCGVV